MFFAKLSKAQISGSNIQSGGSFGSWLSNLGKKALTNLAILLARENLHGLASNLTSNVINKFERNINEKGAVRAGKRFTLFISNENINDIIKIIRRFGCINWWSYWNSKTRKKQEGGFLGALLLPLVAS